MSSQDSDNSIQEPSDFASNLAMQQFVVTLKQQRIPNQKQLQFARALLAKYRGEEKAKTYNQALQGFKSKIRIRSQMTERSLDLKPLQFANTLPLQFALPADTADLSDRNSPFNFSADAPDLSFRSPLSALEDSWFAANKLPQSKITDRNSPFNFSADAPEPSLLSPLANANNRSFPKNKLPQSKIIERNWPFNSSPDAPEPNFPSPLANPDKKSLAEIQLRFKIEQSNPQVLEPSVKEFLSRILNIRVPAIRVYANTLSDTLVKKYSADALTYPDKILFRQGKYEPRKMAGLALLGHELTHLAQSKRQDLSSASENAAIAETEALVNERKVYQYITAQLSPVGNAPPPALAPNTSFFEGISSMAPQPPPSPIASNTEYFPMPKAALSSRDVSFPPPETLPANPMAQLSDSQLNSIKEEVYRDLRQRLRMEFERGS